MNKKRISVNLPVNMIKEVRARMLHSGYSLREKSKWISEAIEEFLKLNEYHALVEMAELVNDFDKTETIYVIPELEEKLQQAVIEVRKKHLVLEGVKSLIIRASIIRRLVVLEKIK